jgi:S-adenosylmethionine:tRNA ribosyltransferase-isomerase
MNTRQISISDYSYELPEERIAQYPVTPRDSSRLLVYDRGTISDERFSNLASQLPEGALMVFNNTKVIHARLIFHKSAPIQPSASHSSVTGARIEIFLLEPQTPADYEQMFASRSTCQWLCMVGNLKKWKEGALRATVDVKGERYELTAVRKGSAGASHIVEFEWKRGGSTDSSTSDTATVTFAELLDAVGQLPIPPYLNRETQTSDITTYQTVYSKIKGSVAAPTAGLHFTPEVLDSIDRHGIDREELTLHVGAGTFKPVKSQHMEGHEMHTEHIHVKRQTLDKLLAHGCQAIAVGTTSVRTLESLYYMGLKVLSHPGIAGADELHVGQWEPYDLPAATMTPSRQDVAASIAALRHWLDRHDLDALTSSTQIMIAPGYEFKIVSHLVTNFHQPQSTLLLLVSAFTKGHWRHIYSHALAHGYRFLSYGDSSLLVPPYDGETNS